MRMSSPPHSSPSSFFSAIYHRSSSSPVFPLARFHIVIRSALVANSLRSEHPFSRDCSCFCPDVQPCLNPLSADEEGIPSTIKYHLDFTSLFSPFMYELKQAYVAIAESLRDALVERLNQMFQHFFW